MILLDTNILVAYLNGSPGVAQRLVDHLGDIAVPALVAAELYYGASASARAVENLDKLERLFRSLPIVTFDLDAARTFGALKAALRQRGRPTGETDAWIAAIALAHDATLVTHNTKDFAQIPGLRLADWLA
ncbi:MAG: type II toxin-antitoxin system VapC family toxin [Nitrospirota bacterium]